jgi:glycosyl-4,4'-diaponeurosporenoate acyltransferase
MIALVWAANVLGWPILHIAIGSIALCVPSHVFARDTWLTAPRPWEQDGDAYRDWLAIRKWKYLLPDGAPWLGGFAKKKLLSRDPTCIAQFLIETRRAEIAHWFMLGCLPIFFIWNPPWARWPLTCPAYLRSAITAWSLAASPAFNATLSSDYEPTRTEIQSSASQATLPDPSVLQVR